MPGDDSLKRAQRGARRITKGLSDLAKPKPKSKPRRASGRHTDPDDYRAKLKKMRPTTSKSKMTRARRERLNLPGRG